MLNICSLYGQQFSLNFNPSKIKYYCINVFSSDIKINFDLGGLLLENVNDSFIYLGVKFRIVKRM